MVLRTVPRTQRTGTINTLLASVAIFGVAGVLSSSPAAQGETAIIHPPLAVARSFEPTMMRVVPYPDDSYALPAVEPYSCYRFRRCSVYDLYYHGDRPNWLTRLAPQPPAESVEPPASTQYQWFFVPVTPEKNILPKYWTASQVRDEYRAVGRPLEEPE
jgi:hypothetical protein